MSEHELKTHPTPFKALWDGKKTFEYRVNDRNYQEGDTLRLREWAPMSGRYSGYEIEAKVTYVLKEGYGLPAGFCVMSIEETFRTVKSSGLVTTRGGRDG